MLTSIRLSLILATAMLASACVNGPDRGPPQGNDRGPNARFEGHAAKPVGLLFASMDMDADRRVDGAELITGIEREWKSMSAPGNTGALDFGGWSLAALGSADALPSFVSFDSDLNGQLSQHEFADRLRTEFAALDKNTDGVLERSELIFKVTKPQRGGRNESGQSGRGNGQDGRRPPPR